MAIAENPDRATDSQWDWVADRPSRGLAPAADAALHFDAVRAVKVGVCPLVLPDSRSGAGACQRRPTAGRGRPWDSSRRPERRAIWRR